MPHKCSIQQRRDAAAVTAKFVAFFGVHIDLAIFLSVGKGGSLASQLAAAETQAAAAAAAEANKEKGKGKKPARQMVLLSSSQRRY